MNTLKRLFFISFLLQSELFNRLNVKGRGLLLHLVTLNDIYILGRTPLDDGSARRRDLYLTTGENHNRETFMHPAGYEPATSAN
jgi:hypothetical protein